MKIGKPVFKAMAKDEPDFISKIGCDQPNDPAHACVGAETLACLAGDLC